VMQNTMQGVQWSALVAAVIAALVAIGVVDVQTGNALQNAINVVLGALVTLAPTIAAWRTNRANVATIKAAGLNPEEVRRAAADPAVAAWTEVAG
jgi:hypothetical protein